MDDFSLSLRDWRVFRWTFESCLLGLCHDPDSRGWELRIAENLCLWGEISCPYKVVIFTQKIIETPCISGHSKGHPFHPTYYGESTPPPPEIRPYDQVWSGLIDPLTRRKIKPLFLRVVHSEGGWLLTRHHIFRLFKCTQPMFLGVPSFNKQLGGHPLQCTHGISRDSWEL